MMKFNFSNDACKDIYGSMVFMLVFGMIITLLIGTKDYNNSYMQSYMYFLTAGCFMSFLETVTNCNSERCTNSTSGAMFAINVVSWVAVVIAGAAAANIFTTTIFDSVNIYAAYSIIIATIITCILIVARFYHGKR